MSNWFTAG